MSGGATNDDWNAFQRANSGKGALAPATEVQGLHHCLIWCGWRAGISVKDLRQRWGQQQAARRISVAGKTFSQGNMTAFFKPNTTNQPAPAATAVPHAAHATEAAGVAQDTNAAQAADEGQHSEAGDNSRGSANVQLREPTPTPTVEGPQVGGAAPSPDPLPPRGRGRPPKANKKAKQPSKTQRFMQGQQSGALAVSNERGATVITLAPSLAVTLGPGPRLGPQPNPRPQP